MKVAVYYTNSDVRIEEMPKPEIGEGELLVKVMASGICGSDVMEWYRVKKAPLVLGHEVAGIVEEVGKGVKGFQMGDRVVVTHHVPCDVCHFCSSGVETMCETLRTTKFYPGGFAEYLRVPKINVEKGTLRLPPDISFEEGTFVEPLGCVVRGQRKIGVETGQTVLVLGSGISGLLHIQLAKARGVGRVIATDVNPFRLNAAKELGADVVINAKDDVPARVLEENNGKPVDRVIVCTGAPSAIKQAFSAVDRGGTILFFAPTEKGVEIPIHVDELWMNEVTLTTSYGAVKKDLERALELIEKGEINVGDMITHRLKMSETEKGFKIFTDGRDSIKVIINPHRQDC
ncbi:MAG TPA: alcohol dehydrogenase [Euryarchaeota archaeon]|nr:sorbitol dehydrogenase [archaeon BMS3Bbin16]HDH28640.1 alcohol dehydrogenase [Euryarchaeota archaeon]